MNLTIHLHLVLKLMHGAIPPLTQYIFMPCYMGPCHHGLTRHQITDGGDGLRMWKAARNILNKQSLTADKGWSPSFRYEMLHRTSELAGFCEHGNEHSGSTAACQEELRPMESVS
jgi:hypothetical protein